MMHSRKLNNKKTRLHGRCSPVTHSDGISSVERDNSVSVRNRNVQCLAIELFKIFDGMCLSGYYEGCFHLPVILPGADAL